MHKVIIWLVLGSLLAVLVLVGGHSYAVAQPAAMMAVTGAPQLVFASPRDVCDGFDVPDAPVRAFRDEAGEIVLFGMHYRNRAMRGKDFNSLKLDCGVVLDSSFNGNPAAYDDRSWITATWTGDGKHVHALIHHEYHADTHPGRCKIPKSNALACWYNTLLAIASTDGGRSFKRPEVPQVMASFPWRQNKEQERHRGFFNPSNIVMKDGMFHVFVTNTGWDGQKNGACLMRSAEIENPKSWRAYDGERFSVRYTDPYRESFRLPEQCKPLAPFPVGVGAVVRHRMTNTWISVFQVEEGEGFNRPGFYYAASRDLLNWSEPRLLLEGKTLYGDPCRSGGRILAYPSLIDHSARTRNFEDTGDSAFFYYVTLKAEGCTVLPERSLIRQEVRIKVLQ
jgi:hypothetical protein